MVDSLIDVYADKASKAGKAADNGSLTSQQWSEVEKELNKRSETQLSKQQIQSKMVDLKKRFQQAQQAQLLNLLKALF